MLMHPEGALPRLHNTLCIVHVILSFCQRDLSHNLLRELSRDIFGNAEINDL